jgi:hypothetical protein
LWLYRHESSQWIRKALGYAKKAEGNRRYAIGNRQSALISLHSAFNVAVEASDSRLQLISRLKASETSE